MPFQLVWLHQRCVRNVVCLYVICLGFMHAFLLILYSAVHAPLSVRYGATERTTTITTTQTKHAYTDLGPLPSLLVLLTTKHAYTDLGPLPSLLVLLTTKHAYTDLGPLHHYYSQQNMPTLTWDHYHHY